MRRTDDGSITLQNDVLLTKPKGLQVRIEQNGIETGHSSFSLFKDLDASLESQILRARNVIFEQELWHELLRESRNLVAYGVVVRGSSISIPLGLTETHDWTKTKGCTKTSRSTKTIILKFATDAEELSSPFSTNEDSRIANAISVQLHLLLSYSHRQRQRQRSQPPPPISAENNFGNPQTQACTLLGPFISHLSHQAAIVSLHSLLSPLTKALESAGLSATYKIMQKPYVAPANQGDKYLYLPHSISEKIIESLIDNIGGEAIFHIKEIDGDKKEKTFTIQFRTLMGLIITTQYRVLGANEAYRAPNFFNSFSEARDYLLFATSCAIAGFFTKTSKPEAQAEQESLGGQEKNVATSHPDVNEPGFQSTFYGNVIRKSIPETNEFREISFGFGEISFLPDPAIILMSTFPKKSSLPLREDDLKIKLNVKTKYISSHDRYLPENKNIHDRHGKIKDSRSEEEESAWWIGNRSEEKSLKEFVEGSTRMVGLHEDEAAGSMIASVLS